MRLKLDKPEQTERLGALLARQLSAGQLILLEGDLGTGKTTMARALIRALPLYDGSVSTNEDVPSPSFMLVQTYERAIATIAHFDLYRLTNPDDVWELGLEDQLDGVVLVEWPDRLPRKPTVPTWEISLTHVGEKRQVEIAVSPSLTANLEQLQTSWELNSNG